MTENIVYKARSFAFTKHENQMYDIHPYSFHLTKAAMLCAHFLSLEGLRNDNLMAACFLHDVLEDTNTTYDEILKIFGQDIADMVEAVTEPDEINGRKLSRKERHALTYPRIAMNSGARIVKLCDRISHVEYGGTKVSMYADEHESFKKALGTPMTTLEISQWMYLDTLIDEVKNSQHIR